MKFLSVSLYVKLAPQLIGNCDDYRDAERDGAFDSPYFKSLSSLADTDTAGERSK